MSLGSKTQGKTYQPFVTTDDDDVVVRSISKRGIDYYAKFGKRGSLGSQERFIGTATGKGATLGTIYNTRFRVEWERN